MCIINTIRTIKKLKAAVSVLIDGKDEMITKCKFIYMKNACLQQQCNGESESNEFYEFLDGHDKYNLEDINVKY